ncbi:MAG: hypothetical protein J6T57_01185 [Alphaproteobacteria bacterium]|nr:hypothetical protein [Alphaproteobacteria bacterium]
MKDKIKNLFGFIGRAWRGGIRGKAGVFLGLFATFMFLRIFWGDVNLPQFVANIWHLNADQRELATEKQKLETINQHIHLLQNYSPDYVEELGLKYLNIGDAKFKILKI